MRRDLPHLDELEAGSGGGTNGRSHLAFENGAVVPLADDREGEQFIHMMCARHAISHNQMLEILSDVEEHTAAGTGLTLEQHRDFRQRIVTGLCTLINYKGDMHMASRCLAFALGLKDVAGGNTAVEVAQTCSNALRRIKKQTVNKCILMFQARMGINPLPGQRDHQAREKFSEARRAQLRTGSDDERAEP